MLPIKSNLRFSDLSITPSDILAAIGYSDFQPEDSIINKVNSLLSLIKDYSNPSYSYTIYDGRCEKSTLQISNTSFKPGQIILHSLKGSTQFAVFTATAGLHFQQWIENATHSKTFDLVDQYIIDCIGTEIVETAANFMQNQLREKVMEEGKGITNRYSPGYCGWNINEQHLLFSLLGKDTCDIRLMDSGLMYPIKSVSGIIGIGEEVLHKEYGCSQCNYPKCFKRKKEKV